MDLYRDILVKALENEKIEVAVTFPELRMRPEDLVELSCYKALRQIRAIMNDETLGDAECIRQIYMVIHNLGRPGSGPKLGSR